MYDVFVRNWWRDFHESDRRDGYKPGDLVPDASGRKHYIARRVSRSEAQRIAQQYNKTHDPGKYSRKAEFEER